MLKLLQAVKIQTFKVKKKMRRAMKRPSLSPAPLLMLQGEGTGNDEIMELFLDTSRCPRAVEAYIDKREEAEREARDGGGWGGGSTREGTIIHVYMYLFF